MSKKSEGDRVQVVLKYIEHKESGVPGTSRHVTTKSRKNMIQRLELEKYNLILKRYTLHREIK